MLVARGGTILLSKGYGGMDANRGAPMPANAIWHMWSVSKQFTAAAVLKLRMMGRLQIDDPIAKYLPVGADKQAITIRMLLNHTSGFRQSQPGEFTDQTPFDQVVTVLANEPLVTAPGANFDYNNGNYTLAAAIVERTSGLHFEDFVRGYLFQPASMSEAGFLGDAGQDPNRLPLIPDGRGTAYPWGNPAPPWVRGAGHTMMPLRQLLYWDYALRGQQILDEAAKTELYRPGLQNYALGWDVSGVAGEVVYSHEGSGGTNCSRSCYWRGAASGVVVALACSRDSDVLSTMAEALFMRARGIDAPQAPAAAVVAPSPILDADILAFTPLARAHGL